MQASVNWSPLPLPTISERPTVPGDRIQNRTSTRSIGSEVRPRPSSAQRRKPLMPARMARRICSLVSPPLVRALSASSASAGRGSFAAMLCEGAVAATRSDAPSMSVPPSVVPTNSLVSSTSGCRPRPPKHPPLKAPAAKRKPRATNPLTPRKRFTPEGYAGDLRTPSPPYRLTSCVYRDFHAVDGAYQRLHE